MIRERSWNSWKMWWFRSSTNCPRPSHSTCTAPGRERSMGRSVQTWRWARGCFSHCLWLLWPQTSKEEYSLLICMCIMYLKSECDLSDCPIHLSVHLSICLYGFSDDLECIHVDLQWHSDVLWFFNEDILCFGLQFLYMFFSFVKINKNSGWQNISITLLVITAPV